jgi:hypothetical protein
LRRQISHPALALANALKDWAEPPHGLLREFLIEDLWPLMKTTSIAEDLPVSVDPEMLVGDARGFSTEHFAAIDWEESLSQRGLHA